MSVLQVERTPVAKDKNTPFLRYSQFRTYASFLFSQLALEVRAVLRSGYDAKLGPGCIDGNCIYVI